MKHTFCVQSFLHPSSASVTVACVCWLALQLAPKCQEIREKKSSLDNLLWIVNELKKNSKRYLKETFT